jgi:hypothetical protein
MTNTRFTVAMSLLAGLAGAAVAVGATTYLEAPRPAPAIHQSRSAVLTQHDTPMIKPIPMGPRRHGVNL